MVSILQRRKLSLREPKPLVWSPIAREQQAHTYHWALLTPEATRRALQPPRARIVHACTQTHTGTHRHTQHPNTHPESRTLIINSRIGLIQEAWRIYKHSFCTYSRLATAQFYDYISNLGPMRLMQQSWVRLFYLGHARFSPVGKLRHRPQPAVVKISCFR